MVENFVYRKNYKYLFSILRKDFNDFFLRMKIIFDKIGVFIFFCVFVFDKIFCLLNISI